jgi:hypothetical protein
MTELKTLKDIDRCSGGYHLDEGALRDEAIKWVKDYKHGLAVLGQKLERRSKELDIQGKGRPDTEYTELIALMYKMDGSIEWITHFFNIEEGELR